MLDKVLTFNHCNGKGRCGRSNNPCYKCEGYDTQHKNVEDTDMMEEIIMLGNVPQGEEVATEANVDENTTRAWRKFYV